MGDYATAATGRPPTSSVSAQEFAGDRAGDAWRTWPRFSELGAHTKSRHGRLRFDDLSFETTASCTSGENTLEEYSRGRARGPGSQ
jgi:hypothetical protein